jgi:hypothetical protein
MLTSQYQSSTDHDAQLRQKGSDSETMKETRTVTARAYQRYMTSTSSVGCMSYREGTRLSSQHAF